MDGGRGIPETVEDERSRCNPQLIPDEEDDEGGDDEDNEEDNDTKCLLLVCSHQLALHDGTGKQKDRSIKSNQIKSTQF